jgi:hypothetical protein
MRKSFAAPKNASGYRVSPSPAEIGLRSCPVAGTKEAMNPLRVRSTPPSPGKNQRGTRRDFLRTTSAAATLFAVSTGLSAAESAENLIVRENRKPGTKDWLLTRLQPARGNGVDDPWERRPAIEGFCSHPSIRAGGNSARLCQHISGIQV